MSKRLIASGLAAVAVAGGIALAAPASADATTYLSCLTQSQLNVPDANYAVQIARDVNDGVAHRGLMPWAAPVFIHRRYGLDDFASKTVAACALAYQP